MGSLIPANTVAAAGLPVVSACTGASLPPSRLTEVLSPLINDIVDPLAAVPLLSGVLPGPAAILSDAVAGQPISLDVLTTTGQVLAPGTACAQQAGGFTLSTPKGITIGGNSIDGLGATGLNANAGEIGSIAFGNLAATAAGATNSIAIGSSASVTGASPNAIAIGNGALATTSGGVALGGGAIDRTPVATAGATLNGTAYLFAGATPASVVSVGAPGAERQIVNVAAGQITAASTDAVNGSELFATNTALNAVGALAGNSVQYDNPGKTSVTLGGVGATTTVVLTNVAPAALNGASTDAVNGSQLFATNTNLTNLTTNVTNGAIGPVQYTPTPNQLALVAPGGTGAAPGAAQNLTNLANGAVTAASTDGINGSQLFASNATVSNFLGGGANVTNGTAPTYAIGGTNYNNVGSALAAITGGSAAAGVKYFHANSTGVDSNPIGIDSVAIGTGAVANNADDVALGAGSATAAAVATPSGVINGTTYAYAGAAPSSVVSVGSPGAERQIQNVAAGQVTATSTDAVNGSQLFATDSALSAIGATAGNSVQYDNPGKTGVTLGGVGAATPVALTNVAAGALTPTSTDAVNGGQVGALGASVATNLGGGSTFNTTTGAATAPIYVVQGASYNNVGGALGATDAAITATNTTVNNIVTGKAGSFVSDDTVTATQPVASGANALAGGFGASATGAGSAVVGNGATDNGVANSTVLGQGAGVAAGAPGSNVALGQGSMVTTGAQAAYAAFGLVGPQTSAGDVSVGTAVGARQISNVAAGSAATDAVNVGQLASALIGIQGVANPVQYDDNSHTSVTFGGSGAPAVTLSNVAPGTLSGTSTQAVNGSQLYATNTQVTNISNGAAGAFQVYQSGAVVAPVASASQSTAGGDGAVASGVGSTAIGYHATSTGANSVALGAGSSDGGQANVVSVGSPGAERRITNVAPGVNGADAVNLDQLNLLAGAFDNSLQAVIREDQAGNAVSLAASGLRYDDRPGTSSVAGGAAYYAGHEGFAFGIGHTSDDGNWRYNLAASFVTPQDHAQVGVIAGVSYTFGR